MKENLEAAIFEIEDFHNFNINDQIRFFCWFLESEQGQNSFFAADIKRCFESLNMEMPRDLNPYLYNLYKKKPAELLKNKNGYQLERKAKIRLNEKYGKRINTIKVEQALLNLPNQLNNQSEKDFLEEAINCFRVNAFRASIVMTWNLVFDYLCNFIFTNNIILNSFNIQLPKSYPKAKISKIEKRDDFSELKEFEILQVCRSANIISNDINKILKEKLEKRNTAAHPSTITILAQTAEEFIIDLITNVVLKLK